MKRSHLDMCEGIVEDLVPLRDQISAMCDAYAAAAKDAEEIAEAKEAEAQMARALADAKEAEAAEARHKADRTKTSWHKALSVHSQMGSLSCSLGVCSNAVREVLGIPVPRTPT
jgi:biotin synthase-related radical SAM superfamily protein